MNDGTICYHFGVRRPGSVVRGALAGRRAPWEPDYRWFQKDRKWANDISHWRFIPPPNKKQLGRDGRGGRALAPAGGTCRAR